MLIRHELSCMVGKLKTCYWILAAAVILVVGIIGTVFAGRYTDTTLRASLLSRTQTIAAGVHGHDLKQLSGSPSDLGTSTYNDIKQEMINIRKANPDARFVYLMGEKSGKLFFYADSEPPESKDYSAPGDPYSDASTIKVKKSPAISGDA